MIDAIDIVKMGVSALIGFWVWAERTRRQAGDRKNEIQDAKIVELEKQVELNHQADKNHQQIFAEFKEFVKETDGAILKALETQGVEIKRLAEAITILSTKLP